MPAAPVGRYVRHRALTLLWSTCFYWGSNGLSPRWLEDLWWRLQLQLLLRIQLLRLLRRLDHHQLGQQLRWLLDQLPRRLLCQLLQLPCRDLAGEVFLSLH